VQNCRSISSTSSYWLTGKRENPWFLFIDKHFCSSAISSFSKEIWNYAKLFLMSSKHLLTFPNSWLSERVFVSVYKFYYPQNFIEHLNNIVSIGENLHQRRPTRGLRGFFSAVFSLPVKIENLGENSTKSLKLSKSLAHYELILCKCGPWPHLGWPTLTYIEQNTKQSCTTKWLLQTICLYFSFYYFN
jgi:hypothetical protein